MSFVFLIGMPASGKSYWGKLLSERYGLPLYDTDILVENAEQKTISEIFKEKGEAYFRAKETEVLEQLIATGAKPCIVACGGGTPLFNDNLTRMKKAGCVIYLETKIDTLYSRLKDMIPARPLLQELSEVRLQQLYADRVAVYSKADHILQTENISLTIFDKIIEQCINRR